MRQFIGNLLGKALELRVAVPHLLVDSVAGDKLAMVAALQNAAVLQEEDLIGVAQLGESVRSHDHRLAQREFLDSFHEHLLALCIDV